jgi:radical SAM modification target selenobiotic family peptide
VDSKELKRILAGFGVATLLAGAGLLGTACDRSAKSA